MPEHYPLKQSLANEVTTIVDAVLDLIYNKPVSPDHVVYTISKSLGKAYNEGHSDGVIQMSHASYTARDVAEAVKEHKQKAEKR
jgi:hypothetical protein